MAIAEDTSGRSAAGSPWEESYVSDIDISGFMDRLYVVLSSEEHLGKYEKVSQIAGMLKGMGFFDISGCQTEWQVTGEDIYLMDLTTFDHSEGTLYSNYYGLPDSELRSAKYVAENDYLLYFALNGLVDKLMLTLESQTMTPDGEQVTLMEMLGEVPDEDFAQVLGMVRALQLDKLLGQILSGEIALVVYQAPNLEKIAGGEFQPSDIDAALMFGIDDSAYVAEMAGSYGPEIGLVEIEIEDPAWRAFRLEGGDGIGFAFNDEILIASPNFDLAALHVGMAETDGGLDLAPCQMHLDIDMEELHNGVIHPAVQLLAQEADVTVVPQHESMMYLFNVPEAHSLGHLKLTESYPDGNDKVVLELKKSVLTYLAFYVALGLDVAAQSGAFN